VAPRRRATIAHVFRSHTSQVSPPPPPTTCEICSEAMATEPSREPRHNENFREVPCDGPHVFCRACLASWISSEVGSGKSAVKCPAIGCTRRLSPADVERLADAAVAARFRELLTADVAGKTRELLADPQQAAWAQAHTKPCPSCHQLIERERGCSSMHCLCGEHFCFECGQSNDPETLRSKADVPERCADCVQRSLFARDPQAMLRFMQEQAARHSARHAAFAQWHAERAASRQEEPADEERDDDASPGRFSPRGRALRRLNSLRAETQRLREQTEELREHARNATAEAQRLRVRADQVREQARNATRRVRSHAREAGAMLLATRAQLRHREAQIDTPLSTTLQQPAEAVVPPPAEAAALQPAEAAATQPLEPIDPFSFGFHLAPSSPAWWRGNLEHIRVHLNAAVNAIQHQPLDDVDVDAGESHADIAEAMQSAFAADDDTDWDVL
jgi:ElaB/YqjD/DUF883 family membrane-anchored ribosome-binding protein